MTATATPHDPLDVERVKKDFPILERVVRGRRLVYLDSANTSQKPRAVLDAIDRYYEQSGSHRRGTHRRRPYPRPSPPAQVFLLST